MTPHEWTNYRKGFDKAAAQFGWQRRISNRQHERDEHCSWTESVWLDASGNYMFDESDISEAFAEEIIRISRLVRVDPCVITEAHRTLRMIGEYLGIFGRTHERNNNG